MRISSSFWLALALLGIFSAAGQAQSLSGAALVNALRQGGYVLVMRHANSPAMPPDKSAADPGNVQLERQLDDLGRNTARAMGDAIRKLRIPIDEALSSPTYRALQTVQYLSLGKAIPAAELDEGGAGMQANADQTRVAWLRGKIAEQPRGGANTIIVTHAPNIAGSFGIDAAAGETLVFRPDGTGGAAQVARVKIADWPTLAK